VGEGTAAARAEVLAARQAFDEELIRLEASARAAADIPAKVRRNPVKAAGLAAATGFVVVGGPRKLFRRAKRAVTGPEEPLPEQMLPEEIEKALKRMGTDGVKVRGLLEREFADYLKTTERVRRNRELPVAVTATLVTAARPFVLQAARRFAAQAFNPDAGSFQDQVARIRARRGEAGIDGPPGGPSSGAGI
jgi:heptaprenylglyceryl phosphate synthase